MRFGKRVLILALVALSVAASAVTPFVETFDTPEFAEHPWESFIDHRDDADRTTLINGYRMSAARVTVPAFTHRGTGGLGLLDPVPDEAWFRYYLRLDSWNATSSGKLPGFAGLYGSSGRGCIPSTETNPGWSARTLFEATGTEGAGPGDVRLGTYLYHLDQTGGCGDFILWDPGVVEQDRWYCVEGHVRMNAPGKRDGRVDAWIDGQKVLSWPSVGFRRAGENVGVRHFWMNVYFGGTVVNPTDLIASVDNLVVSTSGRPGCLDPFADDNTNSHEADINDLYARSILFGCATNASCPLQEITRAQMAALLERALKLPAGPDAFTDDNGHWAEASINALAASGITKGCDTNSFCPNQTVTRAQMAAFLHRAFDLAAGPDAFADDDGHWAEASINALAASGITKGCSATSFCPDLTIRRDQTATFLRRGLGFPDPLAPKTLRVPDESQRVGVLTEPSFDDSQEPLPVLE